MMIVFRKANGERSSRHKQVHTVMISTWYPQSHGIHVLYTFTLVVSACVHVVGILSNLMGALKAIFSLLGLRDPLLLLKQ